MSKRLYLLFDGRSCGGDLHERSTCLTVSDTKEEAMSDAEDDYGAVACYSFADPEVEGGVLTDELWEFDWWPERGFTWVRENDR